MGKNNKMKKTILAGAVAGAIILFLYAFNSNTDFKITKSLDIYYSMFRELNTFYVDETDPEELVKTSIDEMLESLDPYTVYIPEEDLDDLKFLTTGQYGGIGALIRKKDDLVIIREPYKGFPADKAGLKAGDLILEIDGKPVDEMSITQVSENLKGIPKTTVSLKVKSPYKKGKFEVELEREEVQISSLPYYGMLNDKLAYIRITKFTKEVSDEAKKAFLELKKNYSPKGVIIDLRNNPGGLLKESVHLSNIFVGKNEEIVSTRGKLEKWQNTYKTTESPLDPDIPLVVMVSRASASASEIFAGAMQDLDRGVIVGQRTYGKGLVQTTRPLSYNGQLKVTTAKYYIPSGRCIQALDYSHRNEDGSVGKIPDSLISEYTTRNGRKVYDGGGIIPDIKISQDPVSEVTIGLYAQDVIFDYATKYTASHESIPEPAEFEITEEVFDDFIKFIEHRDFDYETESESQLDKLIETAKKEKYYAVAENEFTALESKLAHDRDKDIQMFQDEIKQFLKMEIVSRYYYEAGGIEASLHHDEQLNKAIEIITDPEKYNKILAPPGEEKK